MGFPAGCADECGAGTYFSDLQVPGHQRCGLSTFLSQITPGPCRLIILTSYLILIVPLSLDVLRIAKTSFRHTQVMGPLSSQLLSGRSSDVTTPEKCLTLPHLPVMRRAVEPPSAKPLVSILIPWLQSAPPLDRGPGAQRAASCLCVPGADRWA